MNLELTGRTVKRTVDIARTGSRVISLTDTARPAVRSGTRQPFARHTFVSKWGFLFTEKMRRCKLCYSVGCNYDCSLDSAPSIPPQLFLGMCISLIGSLFCFFWFYVRMSSYLSLGQPLFLDNSDHCEHRVWGFRCR